MNFEPIGYLESCYTDKFGTPRQPGLVEHSWARLKISRIWQPEDSLQGIEGFSHLWLVFVFHKNDNARFHAKVHPPRLGGDSMGVFATRSPHRPNPIGLSLVKLIKREPDSLLLSGIDLIEGTPILDVKPYLPDVESKPDALGGWAGQVRANEIRVEWTEAQLLTMENWAKSLQDRMGSQSSMSFNVLRQLIDETLTLDPRPLVYRGYEGQAEPKHRHIHAVRFFDGDIHFEFVSSDSIQIRDIRLPDYHAKST